MLDTKSPKHVTCTLASILVVSFFCVSSASLDFLPRGSNTNRIWRSLLAKSEVANRTQQAVTGDDPPQCQRHTCPPTKLLADRGSYRKVYFPVAPYAKSRVVGKTLIPATMELYKRLHGYISGDNKKKEKLPMTLPVILRMDVDKGEILSPKNFTMFFYIDPSVTSPPAPNDDDIEVLDVNSYTLYIRTFSGYPVTYGDWMRELLQLTADVEANGEPYTRDFYYFASYDPPSQLTGRINEVQLLKPHRNSMGP